MSEYVRMLGNSKVKTERSKYHTLESHNFHIARFGRCPYCNSGSKPVHKSFLGDDGTWDEKAIKRCDTQ